MCKVQSDVGTDFKLMIKMHTFLNLNIKVIVPKLYNVPVYKISMSVLDTIFKSIINLPSKINKINIFL